MRGYRRRWGEDTNWNSIGRHLEKREREHPAKVIIRVARRDGHNKAAKVYVVFIELMHQLHATTYFSRHSFSTIFGLNYSFGS